MRGPLPDFTPEARMDPTDRAKRDTVEAERRRAEFVARAIARSQPLTKEKREQVATLLAKPRRRGAA